MSADHPARQLVEQSNRVVYSLLKAAVRTATRFRMPLDRLTELLRLAVFEELRRQSPRDLGHVANELGVSLRTASSLAQRLKEDFFRPELDVESVRKVEEAIHRGPRTTAQLSRLGLDDDALRRALGLLEQNGWVAETDGHWAVTERLQSWVAPDQARMIDGLNNQMDILAASVWTRFAGLGEGAGARSWMFTAEPAAVSAFWDQTVAGLRHQAVDLEEAGAQALDRRMFGITVALAPIPETKS